MKTPLAIFSALLVSVSFLLPLSAVADKPMDDEQQLQEARGIVKAFAGNLKGALKPAMESGGPVKAISVCNHQAGPIAENASAQSGWQVSRTSLKIRNEANIADSWELQVLQKFESRKGAGEDINTIEYSEVITADGKSVYRYMKAIPTGGLCLKCHGDQLDGAVAAKLKELYPRDKAVGYQMGDVRGAFSLQKSF